MVIGTARKVVVEIGIGPASGICLCGSLFSHGSGLCLKITHNIKRPTATHRDRHTKIQFDREG